MLYTLCHKNTKVFDFEIDIETSSIVEIKNIYSKEHIPIGVDVSYESIKKAFHNWWINRSIPSSRQNLKEALITLGVTTPMELMIKSFGLSLTDCYWAKPQNLNVSWEKINYFDNPFSEYVGKALFNSATNLKINEHDFFTPDSTSTGWLKKKWVIDTDGKRCLHKGGSGLFQQEPFNETLATIISKNLNFDYVPYRIIENKENYFSSCPNFLKPNEEFIPAGYLLKIKQKDNSISYYEHFLNCCEIFDLPREKIQVPLAQMILLDYIVSNTDRYFGNFGLIRDTETLKIKKLSPIYDTGTSMFINVSLHDLNNPYFLRPENIEAKGFKTKQSLQVKTAKVKDFCKNIDLSKLNDIENSFYNLLKQNKKMEETYREKLCSILQMKVKEIDKLIHEPEINRKQHFSNSNYDR